IAFNTSIIFTNQVMANIGPSVQYVPVIAAGGHVVAHASDIRIFMKKLKGNMRRAKIDDCAWLPTETADFFITSMGIYDEEVIPEKESVSTKKVIEEEATEEPVSSPIMAGVKEITNIKEDETKKELVKKPKTKKATKKTEKASDKEKKKIENTIMDVESDLVAIDEAPTEITKEEK
ncbi:unnamed protein product, partial [marine sediment metagenome]